MKQVLEILILERYKTPEAGGNGLFSTAFDTWYKKTNFLIFQSFHMDNMAMFNRHCMLLLY